MIPPNWHRLEQHPIGKEYPNLHGKPWDQMLVDLQNFGNFTQRPIVMAYDENGVYKVLDGWQLYRAHMELGMQPENYLFLEERSQEKLYNMARVLNNNRRHESREDQEHRIEKRREMVARLRADGVSIRDIAKVTEVSYSQVREDINAINKAHEIENGEKDQNGYKVSSLLTFDKDKFKSSVKAAQKQLDLAIGAYATEVAVYLDVQKT